MSPTRAAPVTLLRRLLATQRAAARLRLALTLHAPSVIVVSSTLKPTPNRDEAHARLRSTQSHTSEHRACMPTPYKFQSIAL